MINIEHEKEAIFFKLIRKGPHVMEFSDDYMMIYNGRIALATSSVLEKYYSLQKADDLELKHKIIKTVAELIDKEYYSNSNLDWYSLREYIANFNVNRLEELKQKVN